MAPRLAELNTLEQSILAWSYATVGQPAPQLLAAIAREVAAAGRLEEWPNQETCNLAWCDLRSISARPPP